MIPTSSRFFYALAAVLAVAAVVYGYTTGGGNVGPISFGYKGAVGDVLGYSVLMGGSLLAMFLGFADTAFRDADADGTVAADDSAAVVPAGAPAASWWPIVGAFSLGLTVVGVALNNVFFVAGLIGLGAVAIEWTMQAWSERATGDPAVNREIRNRIMLPLEVPLAGAAGIAILVAGYSRVFLTLSADNAVWAALVVAAIIFAVGTLLSTKDHVRSDVFAGLLVLVAVVTIGLGIFSALNGEREFHHHEPDHAETAGEESH